MTLATRSTWMPRAATSVATSAATLPSEKADKARLRCAWLRPPWIDSVRTPARRNCRATRSAPLRVRVNTIEGVDEEITSAATPIRSSRETAQK